METMIYLVGKVTNREPLAWEIIGVFDSRSAARRACQTVHYFVWPVVVNEALPDGMTPQSGAYYPLRQKMVADIATKTLFTLHHRGPCVLCCDVSAEFDYCRTCGYTVLSFDLTKATTSLAAAVTRARGGPAPMNPTGYA
jgi:hypothetical protein